MNFTILVWLYCLRILASCKNLNFSSWERSSSHVPISILCFNVPLNVSSNFPLPSTYDSFMIEIEKTVATYSNTLAWKIPWMEELGGLQSIGSLRVGHDWVTSLSLFIFTHWRRKWHPTPEFLPGESQGRGSLVGCCFWGHTELDTTEATYYQQQQHPCIILLSQ